MPEASIILSILSALCRDEIYLQYDTVLNTWHMHWFPGSQCTSLTSKNQQQQIKLRFQDTSDIPKMLGQLIIHFHPFMFLMDCLRLAQAMRDNVSLVTEQLASHSLETRQCLYCTFSLSPAFPLAVHAYMSDHKMELRIPNHPGKYFLPA